MMTAARPSLVRPAPRTALNARTNIAVSLRPRACMAARPRARVSRVVVRATSAAAGGAAAGGEDPYAVLEVSRDTPSDRILASYNRKMGVAKMQLDQSGMDRLEKAHNSIMMEQMRNMLAGKNQVDEVKYSDRRNLIQEYMPWRPRWCPDDKKGLMISGALTAGFWAWTLLAQTDPKLQPLQVASLAFFVQMFMKLNRIDPSPENPQNPERAKAEKKKFFRTLGVLGGLMATSIVLVTFVPVFLGQLLSVGLPSWILTKENHLVNLAATLFMGFGAAFTV